MRVFVPNVSNTKIGGGWTFLRNFRDSMKQFPDFEIVDDLNQADLLFAFAPTTIDGGTIEKAQAKGIPFVLRMDGVPEDSRNGGKGTRRLLEFSSKADAIIYQSSFVSQTVGKIIKPKNNCREYVLFNGVNTDIFTPNGPTMPHNGLINILHVNYRKDPNKRYEEVVQMYRELWTIRQDVQLVLVGRYPTTWQDHNMGFFNGERFVRVGATDNPATLAMTMRSCDLFFYPSFADPAPNVVLETMACGLPMMLNPYGGGYEMCGMSAVPINPLKMLGSQVDQVINFKTNLKRLGDINRMRAEQMFSLDVMGKNYREAFLEVLTK